MPFPLNKERQKMKRYLILALSASILTTMTIGEAQARKHHSHIRHHHTRIVKENSDFHQGGKVICDQRYLATCDERGFDEDVSPIGDRRTGVYGASRIVSHPAGCPRTRFCGCGAALRLFGKAIREGTYAVAAYWLHLPRAEPAPGMAAANHRHVFVIEKVINRNTVVAYDANSGGHLTRIHVRSLAGYKVVNPHRG
jgi:hypothetical protein